MLSRNAVDAVLYDYDRTHTELKKHPTWTARKIDYKDLNENHIPLEPEVYGIAFAQVNRRLCEAVNEVLGDSAKMKQMMDNRIADLRKQPAD